MTTPKGVRLGGRQKGTPNKLKQATIDAAKAAGILPLDYMLMVMRDEKAEKHRRDDMAKSAAPYLHKRQGNDGGVGVTVQSSDKEDPLRIEFVWPTRTGEDD